MGVSRPGAAAAMMSKDKRGFGERSTPIAPSCTSGLTAAASYEVGIYKGKGIGKTGCVCIHTLRRLLVLIGVYTSAIARASENKVKKEPSNITL